MTKVFHELDRDGSGALSFAEVTELARRFYDGRVPTEAKVKSIFRAFDKNEKGEVTLDAMLKMQTEAIVGALTKLNSSVEMSTPKSGMTTPPSRRGY